MTKDGRPSRISDIRYFHGGLLNYLESHHDAVAFGRRLAMFLNAEGFSLGSYPSLYLFLTPTLEPGAVQITNSGFEWWHRYTNVGVPSDFPNTPDASEIVMSATVSALKAIRPDLEATIEHADQVVREHGDRLRFLLQTRRTKRFVVDISFNIATWPSASNLFTSLTDVSSGAFLEGPPLPMVSYANAFDYNGPIKITDIERELSTFVPRTRPVMSKIVKRRG